MSASHTPATTVLPLPPPPPGTASSIALREIVALATHHDLDTARALRDAGIDSATLDDLSGWVTIERFQQVLVALIEANDDESIALRLASHAQPGTFGIVSFIAMVAPTIGDVVERAVVYERLLGDFASTRIESHGRDRLVVWNCRLPDARARRFMTEGVVAAWIVYARWLLNDPALVPREVWFAHEPPAGGDLQPYAAVFGAPVHFRQPVSGIVVDAAFLARPLRQPDPTLFHALDAHARARLAGVPTGGGESVARVAHAIRECIARDGNAGKDAVAAALGLNPRTLLRRLQEQDTTFQSVLDDVRRDLALELTRDATLSQADIAQRLGFRDIRSLQRCFRRWTGNTFAGYRAALG